MSTGIYVGGYVIRIIKSFFFLILLVPTACLESEHSDIDFDSITTPDESNRKLGEELYADHCASCHRDVAGSDKLNTSLARIQGAFNRVPAMWSLQDQFSQTELEAIVVALSPRTGGPSTPDVSTPPPSTPPAPPGTPPSSFDQALYNLGTQTYINNNCYLCHGSNISNSAKRGATFSRIQNAIGPSSPYTQMRSISLTDQQINALVYALNNTPPPSGDSTVEASSMKITNPLGTRHFIASKLQANFLFNGLRENATDDQILAIINNEAKVNFTAFRGGCSSFDSEDLCLNVEKTADSMKPKTSSIRSGALNKTCERIISIDKAITNLLRNASLTSTSPVNRNNLEAVWSIMNLTHPFPASLETSYIDFASQASTRGINNQDTWKFIILHLCKSPFYEGF